MKTLLTVILAVFLTANSYGQNSLLASLHGQKAIKFENVNVVGLKSSFSLNQGMKKITIPNSNLTIEIYPIDASVLDNYFYKASMYNGKYNYLYYSKSAKQHFMLKKKRKIRYLKSENEFLYEGLYYLVDNNIIDDNIYNMFEYEISLGNDKNKDKVFYYSNSKSPFNPYFFSKKYLNLFNIKVINRSNKPVNNNLSIEVINGGESLKRIDTKTLEEFYKMSNIPENLFLIKTQNLLRSDFSKVNLFPAKTITSSYFATPPLNLNNDTIEIIVSDKQNSYHIIYTAKIKREEINKTVKYYELRLKPSSNTFRSYYVISNPNSNMYIIENKIYVPETDVDKPVDIYYFGMNKRKLFYGIIKNFTASEYLNFQQLKRDVIKFKTNSISEVKRTSESKSLKKTKK